jgi:hypothetical protein
MLDKLKPEGVEDALVFCSRTCAGFKAKADHNKNESMCFFILVIACTLLAPMFITLGAGLWLGKVIPAGLSTLAAGATAWLQLRKPQQLWALYRGAQRELEDHEVKRKFLIGEYETARDPDRLLAESVAAIALAAHYSWLPVVPSTDDLEHLRHNHKPLLEKGGGPSRGDGSKLQG